VSAAYNHALYLEPRAKMMQHRADFLELTQRGGKLIPFRAGVAYAVSLSRRWLVEKGFGWLKQTGPLRQVKLPGLERVDWLFVFSCAAHNLIRLPRLIVQRQDVSLRERCA
jgi:hypothetical protein